MPAIDLRSAGGAGGGERGPEGPAGPKGEFNWLGAWSNVTTYAKGDAVEEGGTSFASLKPGNIGHKPSELGEWWGIIAGKGATGATGGVGEKGEKGLIGEKGETGSPKTAKAPLEVAGTEIALKAAGITAEFLGPESVTTEKIKDGAVTDKKLVGLKWENMESYNAGLTQTNPIQFAIFNGMVFIRGLGKISAEVAAKGTLFTLPPAARPAAARNLVYNIATGTATSNLQIKVNGECETATLLALNKIPAFDGLFFSL